MRKFVQRFCLVAALVAGTVLIGCEVEQVLTSLEQNIKVPASTQSSNSSTPTSSRDADTITIASFNIQVFGQSKLKKAEVMEVLAKIARRFDIVAIQEIRSKEENVIPDFVKLINADGSRYDFVIGPRLGRTVSKEQYVFVYDTTRIELTPNSIYTVPDLQDNLHREPLVANFRVRGPPSDKAFSFDLVNIHTDPDETDEELDALADVFQYVQRQNPHEDDVILLGDLNVDEKHLGELGRLPNIGWVVSGAMTNTRLSKSYDNIILDRSATVEYTGQWGVLNLMSEYSLTIDEALKVSDHMPVWAVFHVYEDGAAAHVAGRPSETKAK